MSKFCRRCGASVTEEAKFCRQCGASTTPTQADIQAETQGSNPLPTTILDKTEPMTSIMPEPTQILSQPLEAPSPKKPGSMKWIGMIGLMVVVAIAAFLIGSRLNSQDNPTELEQPAMSSTPPSPINETKIPPSPSTPTPPPTPINPETPKQEVTHSVPKTGTSDHSPIEKAETALPNDNLMKQGIDYLGAQQYDLALKEFEKLRRSEPGNQDVYYLIGQTYHQQGQLQLALEAYEKCTSGKYAKIAQQHVERLKKKLGKSD